MSREYGPFLVSPEYFHGSEECRKVDRDILQYMEDLYHQGIIMAQRERIVGAVPGERDRVKSRLWKLVNTFGDLTMIQVGKYRIYSLSKDYIHDYCDRESRHGLGDEEGRSGPDQAGGH